MKRRNETAKIDKVSMFKGKIVEWNDEKGFGFISVTDDHRKIFFHISSLNNRARRPKINDAVSFITELDSKDRICATQVSIDGVTPITPAMLFSFVFLVLASVAIVILNGKAILISAYWLMSLITYIAYSFDKKAAQQGQWRTAESTLHLLGLLGGWPGALMAQGYLRHKSKKQPFKFILWLTILVNICVFFSMSTPVGMQMMRYFVAFISSNFPDVSDWLSQISGWIR